MCLCLWTNISIYIYSNYFVLRRILVVHQNEDILSATETQCILSVVQDFTQVKVFTLMPKKNNKRTWDQASAGLYQKDVSSFTSPHYNVPKSGRKTAIFTFTVLLVVLVLVPSANQCTLTQSFSVCADTRHLPLYDHFLQCTKFYGTIRYCIFLLYYKRYFAISLCNFRYIKFDISKVYTRINRRFKH